MPGKIHRIAAIDGFFIQRRAHRYIVRNIGNGHIKTAFTIVQGSTVDGIVEILGVLTIDGDKRQRAQINALSGLRLRNLIRNGRQLFQHGPGPDMGNVVTAHCNINLHARLHVIAKYLDDGADSLAALRGIRGNLGHHELPVLGATILFLGNHDLVAVASIVRHHHAKPGFIVVAADDLP